MHRSAAKKNDLSLLLDPSGERMSIFFEGRFIFKAFFF